MAPVDGIDTWAAVTATVLVTCLLTAGNLGNVLFFVIYKKCWKLQTWQNALHVNITIANILALDITAPTYLILMWWQDTSSAVYKASCYFLPVFALPLFAVLISHVFIAALRCVKVYRHSYMPRRSHIAAPLALSWFVGLIIYLQCLVTNSGILFSDQCNYSGNIRETSVAYTVNLAIGSSLVCLLSFYVMIFVKLRKNRVSPVHPMPPTDMVEISPEAAAQKSGDFVENGVENETVTDELQRSNEERGSRRTLGGDCGSRNADDKSSGDESEDKSDGTGDQQRRERRGICVPGTPEANATIIEGNIEMEIKTNAQVELSNELNNEMEEKEHMKDDKNDKACFKGVCSFRDVITSKELDVTFDQKTISYMTNSNLIQLATFLSCYGVIILVTIIGSILNFTMSGYLILFSLSFLAFSLNPLIYCTRNKEFQKFIKTRFRSGKCSKDEI